MTRIPIPRSKRRQGYRPDGVTMLGRSGRAGPRYVETVGHADDRRGDPDRDHNKVCATVPPGRCPIVH